MPTISVVVVAYEAGLVCAKPIYVVAVVVVVYVFVASCV